MILGCCLDPADFHSIFLLVQIPVAQASLLCGPKAVDLSDSEGILVTCIIAGL